MFTPSDLARACVTIRYPRQEIIAALVNKTGITEEEAARATDEALDRRAREDARTDQVIASEQDQQNH